MMSVLSSKLPSGSVTLPWVPMLPSSVNIDNEWTDLFPSTGAKTFSAVAAPTIISTRQFLCLSASPNEKSAADPYPPPIKSARTGSLGIPKEFPSGPTTSIFSCGALFTNHLVPGPCAATIISIVPPNGPLPEA